MKSPCRWVRTDNVLRVDMVMHVARYQAVCFAFHADAPRVIIRPAGQRVGPGDRRILPGQVQNDRQMLTGLEVGERATIAGGEHE